MHGRQRGRGPDRLRRERGDLDLPDHPRLADGGARGRLGRGLQTEPLGPGPRRDRDAIGGWCGRRASRRAPEGCARDHVHGVAGPPAHDPEHVQDRRRADAHGHPCRGPDAGHARPLHLWRPQRRHARAGHRLGDARRRVRAGGPRLRPRRARGHPPVPDPVPPLLRRVPHVARDQQDRRHRGRGHPLPRPGRRRPGLPRPGHDSRRAGRPRHGAEPGRVLPGPGGGEPVPRRRAGHRDRGDGRVRASRPAAATASWTITARRMPIASS